MQQYIFRGLTADNKWVYGSLIQRTDGIGKLSLIEVQDKEGEIKVWQVKDDSVGMWSTISDKHMNDIYQDDLIKVAGRIMKVVLDAGCFLTIWGNNRYRLNQWGTEAVEKVGNVFDNPELLNPASGSAGDNYMLDPKEQTASRRPGSSSNRIRSAGHRDGSNAGRQRRQY
jgi:hypothetical protein